LGKLLSLTPTLNLTFSLDNPPLVSFPSLFSDLVSDSSVQGSTPDCGYFRVRVRVNARVILDT